MRATLLSLAFLVGCGNDVQIAQDAKCDGVQQQSEDAVDAPFDRDGDGFFDGSNLDCIDNYPADRLDCNDGEAAANPNMSEVTCDGIDNDCDEATPDALDGDADGSDACADCDDAEPEAFPTHAEVCFDSIDNDCDGETDEECDVDYTGVYDLDTTIAYTCAFGSVNINFSQMTVTDLDSQVTVRSNTGGQPGTMTGPLSGVNFNATRTITGGCDETYTIAGSFTDADHFDAVFFADYTGSSCANCTSHQWDISGTRN